MKNFNNNPALVKHRTEHREADINIGADVFISVEDAKGILAMTDMKMHDPDGNRDEQNHEQRMNFEMARNILRQIAKAVLYSGGKTTSSPDLINKFRLENLVSD